MIDSLMNLLFRCSHRRLTRPVASVTKHGEPRGESYVVCLDCGKQFPYDLKAMRIGKALPASPSAGVLHHDAPPPRSSKVRVALWASAVPLAWLLGKAVLSDRKKPAPERPELPAPERKKIP